MEVRVATKDLESAKLLVVDLVGLLGGEYVSLRADGEVQLQLRGEANGALVHTLESVERWLEQTRTASVAVHVDERSYTLEHPQRRHRSTPSPRSNGPSGRRARLSVTGDNSGTTVGRR
jgi:hypothetical protein